LQSCTNWLYCLQLEGGQGKKAEGIAEQRLCIAIGSDPVICLTQLVKRFFSSHQFRTTDERRALAFS
jgi:hypothetical protein